MSSHPSQGDTSHEAPEEGQTTYHIHIAGFLSKKNAGPRILAETTQKLDTHSPDGYACPRCRGSNLIMAEDGSAFCVDCEVGFTNAAEDERKG